MIFENKSIRYDFYFNEIHFYFVLIDDEFQKKKFDDVEFAFFQFDIHFILYESFEYHAYVLFVFFQRFEKNKNVIDVNQHKNIQIFFKNFVDVNLKNNKFIDKFKRHYFIFELFVTRAKRNFSFVFFFDANFIENVYDIQFDIIFDVHYFV